MAHQMVQSPGPRGPGLLFAGPGQECPGGGRTRETIGNRAAGCVEALLWTTGLDEVVPGGLVDLLLSRWYNE
jgi:hypothetical protein